MNEIVDVSQNPFEKIRARELIWWGIMGLVLFIIIMVIIGIGIGMGEKRLLSR